MKQPNDNKPQQPAKTERVPSGALSLAAAASTPAHATPSALSEIGSEPGARRAAAPALLFAVLAALLFWGDTHILSQGGDLDAQVHYPFVSSNELASLAIREPEDPRMTQGRAVYSLVCKACHQEDGLGVVAQGFPPLAGSDWVLAGDPSRIIAIVLKGLTGPIAVSGKEYGTGAMVGFGTVGGLSDEEIAGVLSFVRNNWSNKAPFVEVSDVKKMREQLKGKLDPMTLPDLMKIELK
jgi:mono/diheme cytochrome c family protein